MDIKHQINQSLWNRAGELAKSKNLRLTTYNTSSRLGHFIGRTSYAAYTGETRPFGTRSNRVINYFKAPFQKFYSPSIRGERIALEKLISWLENYRGVNNDNNK